MELKYGQLGQSQIIEGLEWQPMVSEEIGVDVCSTLISAFSLNIFFYHSITVLVIRSQRSEDKGTSLVVQWLVKTVCVMPMQGLQFRSLLEEPRSHML